MNCEWVKTNIVLYLYDELPDDARHELEQHLERCVGCAAEMRDARQFRETMSVQPVTEPSPNLLASSRMRLQEALETTEQHGWLRRWTFDPTAWLRQVRFSPALASVILILGFAGGVATMWRVKPGAVVPVAGGRPATAESSIAGIRNIVQQPGSNKVEIQYDSVQPQQVQGSLDDPQIQQLLLYAARNNYNSGVRMDSVDLLSQRSEDLRVREALMSSLRYDKNPGVRLKAIDALRPYVKTDMRVRDAVLEALMNDSNAGVRSEAITLLRDVRADSSVRRVLETLSKDDKNPYIRNESKRVLATLPPID